MQSYEFLQIQTSGATLAVRKHPGRGDPIVLLHGGPGFEDYFGPMVPLLCPPHLVVSYDQRGCGQSSRRGLYRIEDHVADLEALRQALGVEKMHLFGHSWGGTLAQLYAKVYPQHVASLVLCNAVANVGKGWKKSVGKASAKIVRRLGPWKLLISIWWNLVSLLPGWWNRAFAHLLILLGPVYFARPKSVPPSFVERQMEMGRHMEKHAMVETLRSIYRADERLLQELPPGVHLPALLLFGRQDVFVQEEAVLRERFPQAQAIWFEQSGHFPWIEEAETFRAVLAAFYDSLV